MEDWRTRGIPSSHGTAQIQATVGLLQDALTAMAKSRRRADHLHARLFTLVTHVRTLERPTGQPSSPPSPAELQEEINDLGKAAEAVLDAVELAADALWDASSFVRPPLGQPAPRGKTSPSDGSRTRKTSRLPKAPSTDSLNNITRRNDAKYRD